MLAKIGRSAARELFLTGARFSAARAQRDRPGPRASCRPRGSTTRSALRAEDLLAAGPAAVAAAKALIRDVPGPAARRRRADHGEAIAAQRVSAEGQEGLRAFLEKRTRLVGWLAGS